MRRFMKNHSITFKFSAGIGLLVGLMAIVALTGYVSLYHIRKSEISIKESSQIQLLVLEMDRGMAKSRHLHGGFFLQYPRIGLKRAHEMYAQPSIREVARVVSISHDLAGMINRLGSESAFGQNSIDFNLYFSSAKRFADTSIESFELVTRLAAPEAGLEAVINRYLDELKANLPDDNGLYGLYHDFEHMIEKHRLKRERHLMQSAFNVSFRLRSRIEATDLLSNEQKKQCGLLLDRIKSTADEILKVDVGINSKFQDFLLQEAAMNSASGILVGIAKQGAAESQRRIDFTIRLATTVLVGITFFGLIAAGTVAFFLNAHVTRRIIRLTRAAERLKAGTLSIVAVEGNRDELGRLGQTFNYMAARLKQIVDNLEDEVRGRTSELENTNRELQKEIIDRKNAEGEKGKLEEQLRQSHKMEAVGTIAGGIAHDFNNILGIIIGNAELSLDECSKGHPAHDHIREIKTASLRAKDVIRQLLSFSRKTAMEQKAMDISPVLRESLKLIRSSTPSNIEIVDKIPVSAAAVLADATQIHQVLINLCTNAVHAMSGDGGLMEISLRQRLLAHSPNPGLVDFQPGQYMELGIKDTGSGIDDAISQKIFDPYFTTKEIGKGTGMGLAVVHGIVKNHSGYVYVESKPGTGTKITVLLPAVGTVPEVEPVLSDQKVNPRGDEHILFVDDEASLVEMAGKILGKLGYKVTTATNPQKALSMFEKTPEQFDLVITDMSMPEMSGVVFTQGLKRLRPEIPVIICTGHSSLSDEEKAQNIGISAFAMKPVTMTELATLIRDVLDA